MRGADPAVERPRRTLKAPGPPNTIPLKAAADYTLTTLASFNGADGANPTIGLTPDAQGNLYGITNQGGAFGLGTVFRLDAGTHALYHHH